MKIQQLINNELVLGDGPERELVKGEGIISTGFVSNPELYLRVMDCYVLLSKTETSALSLMEAISSGIPIIASAVGLIPGIGKKVPSLKMRSIPKVNSNLFFNSVAWLKALQLILLPNFSATVAIF